MSKIEDLNQKNQQIAYLRSERRRLRAEFQKYDLVKQTDNYMHYEHELEQNQEEIKKLVQQAYEIQKKLPFKNKNTIKKGSD